jgi:hypothetical protein
MDALRRIDVELEPNDRDRERRSDSRSCMSASARCRCEWCSDASDLSVCVPLRAEPTEATVRDGDGRR